MPTPATMTLRLMAVRAASSSGVAHQHPFVSRIVPEMPDALRAGHHIEIVRRVAVRHDHRMISPRNQHDVAVLDRHRFVERAVVGVYALEHETLGRGEAMVI